MTLTLTLTLIYFLLTVLWLWVYTYKYYICVAFRYVVLLRYATISNRKNTCIYLKHIIGFEETSLFTLFQNFGDLLKVTLFRDKVTNQPLSSAIIFFKKHDEAVNALA